LPLQISILIIIGAALVIAGFFYVIRFYKKRKKPRSPFSQSLLRSPGQSLLYKMDAINLDLPVYVSSALVVPLAIYALHISLSSFAGASETNLRIGVTVCVAIGFFIFSVYKVSKLLHKRRLLRLGYEGKLVVGQKLEQLRHDDAIVHDDADDNQHRREPDHIHVGSRNRQQEHDPEERHRNAESDPEGRPPAV